LVISIQYIPYKTSFTNLELSAIVGVLVVVIVWYSNNTGCPIDICQQEQLETVWNQRDLSQGVIKRPLLADQHRRTRLVWYLARRGWNGWSLRTCRKIHWSDESRFLLHVTDGRIRVWRYKNTAYTPRNIQPTVPNGGGSVMVWGCISHDCKLDLVTIQGNLTGDQYIRDVLQPVVVPHFDNHPLATRPVYMDDNTRPRRSTAVTAYLQSEAVTSVPWPAMSPD
jgi:hypothetical protein